MKIILGIVFVILLMTPVNAIHLEEGVTVPIVATYSTMDGEAGVVMNATVIVTEGNGRVFVDTQPYTQMDLQGSARIAALVAADVTGIDPSKYDFYYIIEVTTPLLGGPSAGAALTVATIAEIKNWKLIDGVVMTGMINPDGSIGPIGGIPYKLDAAAQQGTTLFIVPEGQTNVVITETRLVQKGVFVIREENTVEVDLVERGRKLNVNVQEAIDIEDAVELFTGNEIRRQVPTRGVWSAEYLDVLEPLAFNVLNEADLLYLKAQNETSHFPGILQSQKNNLDMAQEQYDDQLYYAATNTGLLAIKNLKFILWSEKYQDSDDKNAYLNLLLDDVSHQVNQSREELDAYKEGGLIDIDSAGAAEIRVVMAEQFLEQARSASSTDQFIDTLAWASVRAETVHWWLTLVNSEHITSDDTLKTRAGWYVGMASSVVTYSQTVISESGGFHGVSSLLNEATDSLDRARIEYERGYYSGAIFDSLLATVQASTAISLLGTADINVKVTRSADAARVAIEDTRNAGIEPVLAVSAYEFADSLQSPSQKIVQYNYARVSAKTTVQLTEPSNATGPVSTSTPIPLRTPASPPPVSTLPDQEGETYIPGLSISFALLGLLIASLLLRR